MKAKTQLNKWTLLHPNGQLDIDGDNCLHLYDTKKRAQKEATCFDKLEGIPKPIRITLMYERTTR